MGNNIKDIQQIKSLIAKGKEMGFLTFEEVNKAVPLEMNTPEQFEEIIGIFDQLEIAIVDLEKDGKKIPVTSAETDGEQSEERLELVDNEDAADFSSRSTDPVRMYLREMGAVPLLDRDGEVTIAKKIEQRICIRQNRRAVRRKEQVILEPDINSAVSLGNLNRILHALRGCIRL